MKRILPIYLILLFCPFYLLIGQNYLIKYDYISPDPIADTNNHTTYYLITNGKESIWVNHRRVNTESDTLISKKAKFFYKNLVNDSVYYQDKFLDRKKVYVKDKLSKNIKNRTELNGANFKLTVSKDIKINDGPWKFKSKNGLIILAESTDGLFKWVMKSLSILPNNTIDIEIMKKKIQNNNFMTFKEFKKQYTEKTNIILLEDTNLIIHDYRPEILMKNINR